MARGPEHGSNVCVCQQKHKSAADRDLTITACNAAVHAGFGGDHMTCQGLA